MAGWDENIMIASVPVEKIQGIADAVDRSTAGTAEPSRQFEQMISRVRRVKK
jgi:translation elongation factor EF-G